MFRALTIRGRAGSIVWNYRPAAALSSWVVVRDTVRGRHVWRLTATIQTSSAYDLKQTPLLFSAPRIGGFWVWPLVGPPHIDQRMLSATLGPPEH